MLKLKRLNIEDKEAITAVFTGVFTKEPWNDDWLDKSQLDMYINDLVGQGYSLTYGLYDDDELIGISLGYIKHWYSGTEYIINEFCVKTERQGEGAGSFFIAEIEKAIKELGLKQISLLTDTNVPAYHFYKKNGFVKENTNVLLEGGRKIGEEMANLANVTREITDAMNEMAAGSSQIAQSVELCHNLSDENQSNLTDLKQEVDLFKIS